MRRCSLYFPSSVITFLIAKGKSFLKRRNGQRALRPTQAVLRPGQRAQRLRWCIASIVHLYSRSFFSGPTNAHSHSQRFALQWECPGRRPRCREGSLGFVRVPRRCGWLRPGSQLRNGPVARTWHEDDSRKSRQGGDGFDGYGRFQSRCQGCNGIEIDRKSTRLNSSHLGISYAVFCLKKKKNTNKS